MGFQILIMLWIGYGLDLLFGDPYFLPHPVRWMGKLISAVEGWLRKGKTVKAEKEKGILLVLIVLIVFTVVPYFIFCGIESIETQFGLHNTIYLVIGSFVCYQMLAAKSLKDESMKVYKQLKTGDIVASRQAVSMIVGRDTEHLDETGIIRAAIETVAENTSDGVIAPMFYMALVGPVGGLFYKAVNTMDSMIGYKTQAYLHFGRCAARLDDLMNYIPARLSALLMLAAGAFLQMDVKSGWKIFKRDRYYHASPNSAQTEAVCAGLLRVRLAGDAYYFGELYQKPTIGDDLRQVTAEDIVSVNKLMYLTAFLQMLVITGLGLLFCGILAI